MDSLPHGITNNFQNNELNFSYAHAVLQSLCFLDSTERFFSFMNNNNMRKNMFFPLANEFLSLIEKVNNGITPDSQNVIIYFERKYKEYKMNIESNNVLSPDPFHFIYFFLQFLHLETNMANPFNNNLDNQPLQAMKNDNYIYRQFLTFIMKTQNSIISNDFFSTVRYTYDCRQMCGEYTFYGLQNIFRMNLDSIRYFRDQTYPIRKGSNLSLDELFMGYSGGKYSTCRSCGNNKCPRYTRICFPAKTIIISLERKIHVFQNDINIFFKIDLDKHISTTRRNRMNSTIYELKAVISFVKFGNDGKYFADCKINKGNLQNMWIRYIDSYCNIIQPNDIFNYEPQILIYERSDSFNNLQNSMNSSFPNNSINFVNPTNNFNNINNQIYNNMNNQIYNSMNNQIHNNMNNQIYNNNNINNNLYYNINNNINGQVGSINMENFNNNFQMFKPDMFNNLNVFRNSIRVEPSIFQNMQLVQSQNSINNNQNVTNSLINIQQQLNNNNNPFMEQVNQFNNNAIPEMKIDFDINGANNEISVRDAQEQNKNMMNLFKFDYVNPNTIIGPMKTEYN